MNEFKISIAAGSKVLLLNSGHSLGIYNLHDNHRDDVTISHEGNVIAAAPGRFIVVSPEPGELFEKINPAQPIACRAIMELSSKKGSIYTGEFSPVTALTSVSCLKDLARSNDPADKKTYRALVKTTIAVMHLQKSGAPFKNGLATPTAKNRSQGKVVAERISMLDP